MSSRGIPDKTKLYEARGLTVGRLKRALNESGLFKVTAIIDVRKNESFNSDHYFHEVCVETENGEKVKIKLDFERNVAYRAAYIQIPRNNMELTYTVEYKHTGETILWDEPYLTIQKATFYEKENCVGTIAFANEYIVAWKNFDDKTGIAMYAGKSQFALALRMDWNLDYDFNREDTDYQELILYFSRLSTPINIQSIYEYITKMIKPEDFYEIRINHYQSISMCDLDFRGKGTRVDQERMSNPTPENTLNSIFVENGIIQEYTTVEGGEAFTVIRDSDAWLYSNNNVVIRKIYTTPIVPRLSIAFRDEETARSNIGKIDLERIFTRIAELQKELQEK